MNKKHWIIVGTVVVFLVMAGCISYLYWGMTEKDSQIASLHNTQLAMDNEQQQLKETINDITGTVNDISTKLQNVRKKQVKMTYLVNKPGVERTQKTKMIDDILAIEGQLKQDRTDISRLKKRLSQSGLQIKSLEDMVANLKTELEQNVHAMASLRSTIEAKDKDLVKARERLAQTNQVLENAKRDLYDAQSTGYYVVGTKDSLKDENVLEEEGRFFFQKKTLHLAKNLNSSRFTKIDINRRTAFTIFGNVNHVKLVPERGSEHFTLQADGKDKTTLRITNPAQFWKIPYMAIVVNG